jgi:lysyl-tRNA synthetase class I
MSKVINLRRERELRLTADEFASFEARELRNAAETVRRLIHSDTMDELRKAATAMREAEDE